MKPISVSEPWSKKQKAGQGTLNAHNNYLHDHGIHKTTGYNGSNVNQLTLQSSPGAHESLPRQVSSPGHLSSNFHIRTGDHLPRWKCVVRLTLATCGCDRDNNTDPLHDPSSWLQVIPMRRIWIEAGQNEFILPSIEKFVQSLQVTISTSFRKYLNIIKANLTGRTYLC